MYYREELGPAPPARLQDCRTTGGYVPWVFSEEEEEESLLHPQTAIHRHCLHCLRIINADAPGLIYGTKEFKERVYKAHRQIIDKSKW